MQHELIIIHLQAAFRSYILDLVFCFSDEEIGGADGAEKFIESEQFAEMNIGFCLDEGKHWTKVNTALRPRKCWYHNYSWKMSLIIGQ